LSLVVGRFVGHGGGWWVRAAGASATTTVTLRCAGRDRGTVSGRELPRTNVASRNRIDHNEDPPGGSHRAARPHHGEKDRGSGVARRRPPGADRRWTGTMRRCRWRAAAGRSSRPTGSRRARARPRRWRPSSACPARSGAGSGGATGLGPARRARRARGRPAGGEARGGSASRPRSAADARDGFPDRVMCPRCC